MTSITKRSIWRSVQLAAVGLTVLACARPTAPAATEAPPSTGPVEGPAADDTVSVVSVGQTSGPLIEVSLANLSKTLHPYPDSASYTQSWGDVANLIWGASDGGLLSFDWGNFTFVP